MGIFPTTGDMLSISIDSLYLACLTNEVTDSLSNPETGTERQQRIGAGRNPICQTFRSLSPSSVQFTRHLILHKSTFFTLHWKSNLRNFHTFLVSSLEVLPSPPPPEETPPSQSVSHSRMNSSRASNIMIGKKCQQRVSFYQILLQIGSEQQHQMRPCAYGNERERHMKLSLINPLMELYNFSF